MPRIALIPSTIAFGDRGVEAASPIIQNAMQLAETFTTEVPKLRMQQEAIAEEKNRYATGLRMQEDERAYRRGRDAVGDQRYDAERSYREGRDKIGDERHDADVKRRLDEQRRGRLAALDAGSAPDGFDVDGDGVADFAGGMTGRGRSVPGLPSTPGAMSEYQGGRLDLDMQKRIDNLRDSRARHALELSKRYVNEMGHPRPLTAQEQEAVQRDVDRAFPMNEAPVPTVGNELFGEMQPIEAGGDHVAGPAEARTPEPLRMSPVYTDMRKQTLLEEIDRLRDEGVLTPMQAEQRKMLIMGSSYPGAAQAPAPTEAVDPMSMAAAEAPVAEVPVAEEAPVAAMVEDAPVATTVAAPVPAAIQRGYPQGPVEADVAPGEALRRLSGFVHSRGRADAALSESAANRQALGPGERMLARRQQPDALVNLRGVDRDIDALAATNPRAAKIVRDAVDAYRQAITAADTDTAAELDPMSGVPGLFMSGVENAANQRALPDARARLAQALAVLGL